MTENKAVLIDGMHLCYRHYHTRKNDDRAMHKGIFVGMFQGFFSTLKFVRKRFPGHGIYVLWDSKTNFRYKIYPDYKKKIIKDPVKEKERKQDKQTIQELLIILKEMLRHDGVHQVRAEGFEADDIAGYMTSRFRDYDDIILWTGDKDWTQLLAKKNVRWVNVSKDSKIFTAEDFEKKEGYPPSGVPVFKSLTGDKSDNIKGLCRFPKKLAIKIATRYVSIEGLFYDRAGLNDIPERWRDEIKDNASHIRMNFQLIWLDREISNARLISGVRDKEKLAEYFEKYGIGETQSRSKRDEFFLKRMKRRADK